MNKIIEPKFDAPRHYTGSGKGNAFYETLRTVVLVLLTAFIIRVFIMQPFLVQGASMEPTLTNSEYLIVEKVAYKFRQPERGEIVVFRAPVNWTENYIKRVIALPGETIKIEDSKIFINNKVLEESYIESSGVSFDNPDYSLELTLGEDEYFVIGDNRNHSSDSRSWGPLPRQNIIGRAFIAIFPLDFFGIINSPDY